MMDIEGLVRKLVWRALYPISCDQPKEEIVNRRPAQRVYLNITFDNQANALTATIRKESKLKISPEWEASCVCTIESRTSRQSFEDIVFMFTQSIRCMWAEKEKEADNETI